MVNTYDSSPEDSLKLSYHALSLLAFWLFSFPNLAAAPLETCTKSDLCPVIRALLQDMHHIDMLCYTFQERQYTLPEHEPVVSIVLSVRYRDRMCLESDCPSPAKSAEHSSGASRHHLMSAHTGGEGEQWMASNWPGTKQNLSRSALRRSILVLVHLTPLRAL
jgi:hypothetical protein